MTPEELKKKKESEAFQAKYGASGPEGVAPEEAGTDDSLDQLVPSPQDELKKNGWLMGELPAGPEATGSKTGSIIAQLRKAGMEESKIAQAAQDLRLTGSTRFTGPGGKVVADIGYGSPLGKELTAYGRAQTAAAESRAPLYKKIGRAGP